MRWTWTRQRRQQDTAGFLQLPQRAVLGARAFDPLEVWRQVRQQDALQRPLEQVDPRIRPHQLIDVAAEALVLARRELAQRGQRHVDQGQPHPRIELLHVG